MAVAFNMIAQELLFMISMPRNLKLLDHVHFSTFDVDWALYSTPLHEVRLAAENRGSAYGEKGRNLQVMSLARKRHGQMLLVGEEAVLMLSEGGVIPI